MEEPNIKKQLGKRLFATPREGHDTTGSSKFWKEIKRMKGTRGQETHEMLKDENGRILKTEEEEVEEAFKDSLERTFKINEEENE